MSLLPSLTKWWLLLSDVPWKRHHTQSLCEQPDLAGWVAEWRLGCDDNCPIMLPTAELYCPRGKPWFHFPALLQCIILSTCIRHPENNIKWTLIFFGLGSFRFCIALKLLEQEHEEPVYSFRVVWPYVVPPKLSPNIFQNVKQQCLV